MNDYSAPRCVAALCLATLLAACASAPKKPPAPAAPPPPAAPQEQPAPTPPPAPVMQPQAPQRYLIKKGDTLWGIASLYLKDPWLWPDIWYANPAIKNPHLIYPGDELMLGYINGRPVLTVERNGQVVNETTASALTPAPVPSLPVVKIEPQARYSPLGEAVPSIPLSAIGQFLSNTRVISKDELKDSGYLLSSVKGSYATGLGEEVYARGLEQSEGGRYDLYRLGDKYEDPQTGENLGYEASYVGQGLVEAWGDPSKLLLSSTAQEAYPGERFLPTTTQQLNQNFMPHKPEKSIKGDIIAVLGGEGEIGQYQVVVLDRGSDAGLDPGMVLGAFRKGSKVDDPYAFGSLSSTVTTPDERSGTLMVFRTFPKVSYALVMRATREIHVLDVVKNP